MENDGLDELFPADDASAAEEAATAAAEPDAEIAGEDGADEADVADGTEGQPGEGAAAEAPAASAWDSPENPYARDAMALRAIRQLAEQAAAQKRQAELRETVNELVEGDPERQQAFGRVLSEAVGPLQQRLAQSERIEKATAAFLIAAQAHVPEETMAAIMAEMGDLMAVEGADVMQQRVEAKRAFQRQYADQLTARDARIAELEAMVGARQELAERRATGADAVDGGTGMSGLSRRDRIDQAKTDDDFFAALFSRP